MSTTTVSDCHSAANQVAQNLRAKKEKDPQGQQYVYSLANAVSTKHTTTANILTAVAVCFVFI